MKRIMLIDDERSVLQSLQRSLRDMCQKEHVLIEPHLSPIESIKRLSEAQFHIIISDYHMPEMSGVDFFKIAKVIQPDAIRLMLSASAEFKTALSAINDAEVFRYIEKPWDLAELKEIIQLSLAEYARNQAVQVLVDNAKKQQHELTSQELERIRLEKEEPGITKVKRGPDGSILLDEI